MNHKLSTYVLIGMICIGLLAGVLATQFSSEDIDNVCATDNMTLFRWAGEWRCANLNDAVWNISVNNVTVYNNYTSTANNSLFLNGSRNLDFKKYSDFNYVSIQGNELVMPKAGNNYFYLDENVSWYDIRVSNGTLGNRTLDQAETLGWMDNLITYYDNGWLNCVVGFGGDTEICLKDKLSFAQTNVNNLTLIFPNKNPTYNNVTATNYCNSTICKPLHQWINDTTYVSKIFGNNTYQKYSDYQMVSVSNSVLNMPKAGWNYFYLDEATNWSLINISNGTIIKTLSQGYTAGWVISSKIYYGEEYCEGGAFPDYTNICPANTLLMFQTVVNNLTLIFPSTTPTVDSWTSAQIMNDTLARQNTSVQFLNVTANITINRIISGEIYGTCTNSSGYTFIGNLSNGAICNA